MQKYFVGIDIGTAYVKVIVAAAPDAFDMPMQIIGTGTAASRGMRQGYVADLAEVSRSVREAVQRAASAAKVPIKTARLSVGGVSLECIGSTGETSLTPSGGIVGIRDLRRAEQESEKRAHTKLVNRTIIHTIPLEYRVDGTKVYGKPQGMQGAKLSVDTLLVTVSSQHHDDLIEAVESAGIEVDGVMAPHLAASLIALTKSQRTAGVVLANIGAETTSVIVFDNDFPISLKVFPHGSADITNAIALSFQLSLPEAEQLKRGALSGSDIPEKKIQTLIVAQLKKNFTEINAHLKTIGHAGLLPAGVVLVGGGAASAGINEVARLVFKLPAQAGQIVAVPRTSGVDTSWAVAYGLCRWAFMEESSDHGHSLAEVLTSAWDKIRQSARSLLP